MERTSKSPCMYTRVLSFRFVLVSALVSDSCIYVSSTSGGGRGRGGGRGDRPVENFVR